MSCKVLTATEREFSLMAFVWPLTASVNESTASFFCACDAKKDDNATPAMVNATPRAPIVNPAVDPATFRAARLLFSSAAAEASFMTPPTLISAADPTPATPIPNACSSGGASEAAFTNPVTPCTRPRSGPSACSPALMSAVSIEPRSCSRSPDRLFILVAAASAA